MKFTSTFLTSLLLAFSLTTSLAGDWYVSGKGNDQQDGKALATSFRTLKKASEMIQPGDTVHIGEGIYADDDSGNAGSILPIATSGKPDAWITWKVIPGTKHEIRASGWNGVVVTGSYIILDGLTVTGANDSITLLAALTDGVLSEKDGKKYPGSPRFNTNGITVEGRKSPPEKKPHHIIIRNCVVSKCPGGGITALEADYVTIEDNRIFENAWFMRYGGSGITTLNNWAFDDAPGYHIIVQRNLVWNNKTLVPWAAIGKLSDGNGILLDVTDNKTSGGAANPNADVLVKPDGSVAADPNAASLNPQRPEWKGRALIANNVSAYNGGSGIHTFRTKHVDIINNTTYWNGQVVGYPELFANRSEDVSILNNIIVPRPDGKVTSNNRNQDIRWDYNIYPIDQDLHKGAHDIVAEPLFVSIRPDLREADFRLAPESLGRDSGTDELPQSRDVLGNLRPSGKGRDRGAYEQ